MFILGLILGFVIGFLTVAYIYRTRSIEIEKLKETLESKIKASNSLNSIYKKKIHYHKNFKKR